MLAPIGRLIADGLALCNLLGQEQARRVAALSCDGEQGVQDLDYPAHGHLELRKIDVAVPCLLLF